MLRRDTYVQTTDRLSLAPPPSLIPFLFPSPVFDPNHLIGDSNDLAGQMRSRCGSLTTRTTREPRLNTTPRSSKTRCDIHSSCMHTEKDGTAVLPLSVYVWALPRPIAVVLRLVLLKVRKVHFAVCAHPFGKVGYQMRIYL